MQNGFGCRSAVHCVAASLICMEGHRCSPPSRCAAPSVAQPEESHHSTSCASRSLAQPSETSEDGRASEFVSTDPPYLSFHEDRGCVALSSRRNSGGVRARRGREVVSGCSRRTRNGAGIEGRARDCVTDFGAHAGRLTSDPLRGLAHGNHQIERVARLFRIRKGEL